MREEKGRGRGGVRGVIRTAAFELEEPDLKCHDSPLTQDLIRGPSVPVVHSSGFK